MRCSHQPGYLPAIGGLVGRPNNVFVEVVGLFKLVPEELVGLGELKVVGQVELLLHLVTDGVEGGEHPAAAGLLLVSYVSRLEVNRKVRGVVSNGVPIKAGIADPVFGDGAL